MMVEYDDQKYTNSIENKERTGKIESNENYKKEKRKNQKKKQHHETTQ